MPSELYIEHFQRVQGKRFVFRGWTVAERVGKFLMDTADGQTLRPQEALHKALFEGDQDAAVQIALRVLPSSVWPFDVTDRPTSIAGEILTESKSQP